MLRLEIILNDFEEREETFFDYEKQNFSKSHYRIFPKGLTQGLAFFDQKHELTPLEKCDFKDFETFRFYSQKRFHFSLQNW